MEKNINVDLGGFSAVLDTLSRSDKSQDGSDYNIIDPKDLPGQGNDDDDDLDGPQNLEDQDDIDDDFEDSSEDDLDDDLIKNIKSQNKNTKSDKNDDGSNISDFGEMEEEMAEYLQEKLFESFGWDKGEVELKSIEEMTEFIKTVIEENSKPDYASEDLYKMDEYVRNGGDLKEFYNTFNGNVNLDKIDLDNIKDQEAVVMEDLLNKGYTEVRAKRTIERYIDANILQDEAEDAKESVKEYREKETDKLLTKQKKEKADIEKRQLKYFQDVETEIKALKDIRGVEISDAEKKQLLTYIFKPTSNGQTQYQNDYTKSQKNLIESAYFTMKGDKLIQKVATKANSDAAIKLRKKLANKGKRGKDQGDQGGGSSLSFLDLAASQLRKPTF